MSKNITIQEGNRGRNFTAGKLKTALQGGGSCLWVPEAEVQLDSVDIDRNGTVTAASRGVYGFADVYVYVEPSHGISGKDPDTGEDVYIDVDGEETRLPERIAFVKLPNKLVYQDGGTINLYGAEIHAYYADGEDWGDIGNRVSVEPTKADISQASGGGGDDPIVDLSLSQVFSRRYSYGPWGEKYWPDIAVWSPHNARVHFSGIDAQTRSPITLHWDAEKNYYVGNIDINGNSPSAIYGPATLNYLTVIPARSGPGKQTITVLWPRPMDGKVLSTSFEITVQS